MTERRKDSYGRIFFSQMLYGLQRRWSNRGSAFEPWPKQSFVLTERVAALLDAHLAALLMEKNSRVHVT